MAEDIRLVLSVDDRDLLRARKEQEKYQYRIAQIEKEFRKGNITASRYNKELANQARELAKLGGGYNKANSEIRKYAYSLRNATDDQLNLAQAMAKSGKGMRRMEILAQQAGYQIGDFAVQVQSGTNVAVAFGQQMSQLLGFFGPMGAVAGAGIAIGTGLIAPLLNAKGAARDLSEELEELEAALGEVAIGAEASISAGLTAGLVAAQSEVNRLIALTQSEDFQRAMGYAAGTAEGAVATSQIEQAVEAAEKVVEAKEEEIGKAGILEAQERVRKALIGDQAQEAQNVAEAKRIVLALDEKTRVAAEKLEKLEQGRADATKAQFDALMSSIQANDRANAQAEARQKAADSSARDRLRLLMQQNAVLDLQLKYGSDSEKIETLRNAHTVANLRASLEKQGVDQSIVDVLVDQQNKLLTNKAVLEDMNEEAVKFKELMKIDYIAIDPESQLMEMSLKPSKQSGPKKEPKPKTKSDPLADLRKQLALENALQGQTEARRRIIQALGVDYMEYGASTIKSLEDQINKTIELRKENERFAEEVEGPLTDAFGDVADAFGEFIANGLKDFKDFTKSIVASFKQMLAQMISAALRNRIFIPIATGMSAGFGSSAAASTMGSYAGGSSSSILASMGSSLVTGLAGSFTGSAFGSGLMAGVQGFAGGFAGGGGLMGGLSGYGATLSATAANAGIMGTIGAAVPAIAAVALVIGAFSSKTKELDSGLKATIKTNDVLIESYRKMEKSRFFGLSKKKYTIADTVEGSPLEQQILQLQHGIMSMAKAIGVADDVFNDFLYSFNISLKGLNEDEKLKKINEELGKMGDAFASLIPNVENLDQLNAIMNERANLEIRLLQAQGNTAALREIELAGTNEYNRALLRQVFAAEDARDAIDEVTNSLQENSFATKLQFERAKAYSRLGLDAPANTNSVPMNTPSAPVMSVQRDPSIEQLRREMRSMHEETMVAYSKLIKNTKDNKNILRGWDIVGLPAERSA